MFKRLFLPKGPLFLEHEHTMSMRWLANPNMGHSHFLVIFGANLSINQSINRYNGDMGLLKLCLL
jgi:hypothetical protein